jgi:TonB-dependent receptor
VTDDIDLRFNASRSLTRPPIDKLNPVTSVGSSRIGTVTANGGNADLLPVLSDNLDVGAAWYYAQNSYLSAGVFLKAVDNFIVNASSSADYGNIGTECQDPATKAAYTPCHTGIDVPYTITKPVNGPAANVYGIELAWQHMFGESGFGYQVNGTIVGTNKPYSPYSYSVTGTSISGFAVTGLSDSFNAVMFYDKDGFQARLAANWQDSYLDHFGQIQNGSAFGTEPTFVNTNWNLDFSTSYDVTSQVTIFFEANNLTDATYSTHGRFSNQLLDVVDYGRKLKAGVHFKL